MQNSGDLVDLEDSPLLRAYVYDIPDDCWRIIAQYHPGVHWNLRLTSKFFNELLRHAFPPYYSSDQMLVYCNWLKLQPNPSQFHLYNHDNLAGWMEEMIKTWSPEMSAQRFKYWKMHEIFKGMDKKGCYPIFVMALRRGYAKVAKILMDEFGLEPSSNELLVCAQLGHQECFRMIYEWNEKSLIPPTPSFYFACSNGHRDIVMLLADDTRIDHFSQQFYALRMAAKNGHHHILKRLLQIPNMDAKSRNNFAMRWAEKNGHTKCVDLLKRHEKGEDLNDDHQQKQQDGELSPLDPRKTIQHIQALTKGMIQGDTAPGSTRTGNAGGTSSTGSGLRCTLL